MSQVVSGLQRLSVSAIIPTRDRPADLRYAVESVLRQTRLPDELVVVDQSVGDDSKHMVLGLAGSIDSFTLTYIHDPTISGLVAAKEVGVAKSSGDVVLFLEDDILLEKDFVEQIVEPFTTYEGILGACGVIVQVPNAGRWYYRLFHLFHRGIFKDNRVGIFGNPDAWTTKLVRSRCLSGGMSAYRREIFSRVPFDVKNGFFILEDVDFSIRAANAFGEEHFFINTSARLHHVSSPVNRPNYRRRYTDKARTYICFYKKNRTERRALRSLIWLMIGLFLEAGFSSVHARSIEPLLGYFIGVYRGIRWKIRPEQPLAISVETRG